ncbi:MAG: ferredoxin [Acidobacteriota bacterium]|nr:ferredoxin [Acidobacteriota bacterium]
MPVRDVIEINEDLCDGCGDCVTACAEGALAIIDGKARLVSDIYCDGLGVCLGHCPQGAITVTRREAGEFDEAAVAKNLASLGAATVPSLPLASAVMGQAHGGGCPGSRPTMRNIQPPAGTQAAASDSSQLRHWPVQLHLVPPTAPFFCDADVLLAADCVAFAVADFHNRHLAGRSLAIACPKLDSNQEIYLEKLVAMIDTAKIRSLRVMIMEVPCCGGLARLAEEAVQRAQRKIPVELLVVGTGGQILGAYPLAG